ncbi:MAG: LppP/LprE family lipoprotein [Rhodospirillales bacterium]|nr:LppP/LprE family lipoprotein [Rhodospirillales bacterium]
MSRPLPTFFAALLFIAGTTWAGAQELPAANDSRHSMLRVAMLGLVSTATVIPESRAQQHCIELPARPPLERIQGPHGDVLLEARCSVVEYQSLGSAQETSWTVAKYQSTLVFNAEDTARGADARDIVTEDEVVLFEMPAPGQVRAVWHRRFETAFERSVTPEIAPTSQGTVLLSVMTCLSGTGGCGQVFLQRRSDGKWFPVTQDWSDQLPPGFADRIRHGVRIDPGTLEGEAGFYADQDPNCCPSQRLAVRLRLRGDALILIDQAVAPWPNGG